MAVDFDGTNDYIACGSGATLDNIWDGGGAMAYWVRFDTIPTDRGLAEKNPGARRWDNFVIATNPKIWFSIDFNTGDGAWTTPNDSVATGAWYHVAIVYNADATTNDPVIYINGASQSITESVTPAGTRVSDAATSLTISRTAASGGLDGQMEDIRAYSRTLTAAEVSVLAAGYRGPLGGEVLWLSMNDFLAIAHPDGATLTATTNNLPDMSGNGNDGVPTNSPVARASSAPRWATWLIGVLGGDEVLTVTLTGGITPTGALIKDGIKAFVGGITPTGAFTKLTQLVRTGNITPSGVLAGFLRLISLVGSVLPTGGIATRIIFILRMKLYGYPNPSNKLLGEPDPTANLKRG